MNGRYCVLLMGIVAIFSTCIGNKPIDINTSVFSNKKSTKLSLKVGAEMMTHYVPILQGKHAALVVNQTSRVGERHLVDTLLRLGIDIDLIFAPEHGFRGLADAGQIVEDGIDIKTGIPIVSLYGKNKKPLPKHIENIDVILFDIQDVGARFYTYISTMHYVMEACAEQGVDFVVLDRPNPNGFYVDGPILQKEYTSFVGMHPVPIVHGMTVGEYAQMINGEYWLRDSLQCLLQVVPCQSYTHYTHYSLPIAPSPNLPNSQAVYLYPSLCLFEGTNISVGRGTDLPFQVIGHPHIDGLYQFTPQPNVGARYPKHKGVLCWGDDLSHKDIKLPHFSLSYLFDMYTRYEDKTSFFLQNHFFDKLAGSKDLRQQIEQGLSENQIRKTWQPNLYRFKKMRKKYLLYPDFE